MSTVQIGGGHENERVDSYICANFRVHSRNFLTNNWEKLVQVNGKLVKPSYKLKEGDIVEVLESDVDEILSKLSYEKIIPQDASLDIVYENSEYLVLNKPKGVSVHPGVNNTKGTLANYVVGYLTKKGEYDATMDRGGVVHRLDKSVSGLIVFAKNKVMQKHLQKQFENHMVQKIYLADIVIGENSKAEVFSKIPEEEVDPQVVIDEFVRNGDIQEDNEWLKVEGYIGRSSMNRKKTIFKTYPSGNAKYSLSFMHFLSKEKALIVIKTGRMYQIRASFEYLGIYIKGDTLFQTFKGGATPNAIKLESIYLSFEDMHGKLVIYRSV